MTKPLLAILLLLPLSVSAEGEDFDLAEYCERLSAQGMSSSECPSANYTPRKADKKITTAVPAQKITKQTQSGELLDYCERLRAQGVSSSDCSASDRVRLETANAKARSKAQSRATSILACEQYSQLVYNHIMGNRTPPPMRQVVVINQRRPTEYEGEITGCGMFSCTVELRETYRSRWNRQFRQTSDNLGQSLENLGYMIGSASARAKLRRNAENQKEAKYKECLRTAGYR